MMTRRAHMLLVAIVVTGMVGTTLYLLNRHTHALALHTQQAQLDAEAAQLIAAGKWWAQAHRKDLLLLAFDEAVDVDTSDLKFASNRDASLQIRRTPQLVESAAAENGTDSPYAEDDAIMVEIKARTTTGRQTRVVSITLALAAGE